MNAKIKKKELALHVWQIYYTVKVLISDETRNVGVPTRHFVIYSPIFNFLQLLSIHSLTV